MIDDAAVFQLRSEGHSIRKIAQRLGVSKSGVGDILSPKKPPEARIAVKGRKEVYLENGGVLVASDMHYWPGEPSTAHRAFVKFCKRLKPSIVAMNGDVLDAAAISRHPPIGWNKIPSVKEELEVCQERLGEIVEAAGNAKRFWMLGNHDSRFECRLAQVAPEFKDVHGISLSDHFPEWVGCWSLHINNNTVIKHRYKGGLHAPHNNTVTAGRSIITGHLHSQKVTPFSDYNGTRYGVDTGCLADPSHDAFTDYTEDNPKNWRSGFCVLTYRDGCLLYPELVTVWDANHVQFRGELIEV
jgi:predicted phosphodiesterase